MPVSLDIIFPPPGPCSTALENVPLSFPTAIRTVAINGSAWRWVRALLGAQGSGSYRLVLARRSSEQLKVG